jgi:FKBP-type peptidyl-prolyl cis-trans isomerase FkpA
MLQKKHMILGGASLGVIALVAGGFLLLGHHGVQSAQASLAGVDTSSGESDGTPNTVPLDPPSAASNSGGLAVASGGAANSLGQIAPSTGSASDSSSSQASGSAASSSSSSPVNPSTFAQYNKYQSSTSALFGDIQVGTGATLGANQQASVYYKGWLTNGTLFDESRTDSSGNLQPFTFTMGANQVIPGWEEGMSGMKVGGTRLIIVPPAVGYGAAGQGTTIPPNSVLVFEVELLSAQ